MFGMYVQPGGSPSKASIVKIMVDGKEGGQCHRYPKLEGEEPNFNLIFENVVFEEKAWDKISGHLEVFKVKVKKEDIVEWEYEKQDIDMEATEFECTLLSYDRLQKISTAICIGYLKVMVLKYQKEVK